MIFTCMSVIWIVSHAGFAGYKWNWIWKKLFSPTPNYADVNERGFLV